jgi:hypothetical protein
LEQVLLALLEGSVQQQLVLVQVFQQRVLVLTPLGLRQELALTRQSCQQ